MKPAESSQPPQRSNRLFVTCDSKLKSRYITPCGPMVDLATLVVTAASAFFVVLAIGLLVKYRQTSQRIAASTDLGRDLWDALETRLKKQDERILDMMARVEVIQSRTEERHREEELAQVGLGALQVPRREEKPTKTFAEPEGSPRSRGAASRPAVTNEADRILESRLDKQGAQIVELMGRLETIQSLLIEERVGKPAVATRAAPTVRRVPPSGGSTERQIIEMLSEKPRTSVEIRQRFDISREHSARLLKGLFDRGLVIRNDSGKPFVYEITEAGRRYLSAG